MLEAVTIVSKQDANNSTYHLWVYMEYQMIYMKLSLHSLNKQTSIYSIFARASKEILYV